MDGDGQEATTERLAYDLDLDPTNILGSRLDIPNLLANSDIFALSTTEDEGFGIMLIEAMAAGLPIIATVYPHVGVWIMVKLEYLFPQKS